jgi:hypothetical protein
MDVIESPEIDVDVAVTGTVTTSSRNTPARNNGCKECFMLFFHLADVQQGMEAGCI